MAKTKKKSTRRANGEGSVYKINDGRYGAAVDFGKDKSGKRIRVQVTGKTEEEASQKMMARLEELNTDKTNARTVINSQTLVEDAVKEFLTTDCKRKKQEKTKQLSSRTYENYQYCLKYFEDYFCGRTIGTITSLELIEFFDEMIDTKDEDEKYKYSQTTLHRVWYLVNRMFARAYKKGYISIDPFEDDELYPPISKQEKHAKKSLDLKEVELIFRTLRGNKQLYIVIEFMLQTGVRTQEALALKWKSIDFENKIVKIENAITTNITFDKNNNKISRGTIVSSTKTSGSNRELALNRKIYYFLKWWKKVGPIISKTGIKDDDFVFGNSKSDHWTYSGFRCAVNKYLESKIKVIIEDIVEKARKKDEELIKFIGTVDINNLKHLRLHDLRRTFSTIVQSSSNEPPVVHLMQMLGHTQIKTTMKYIDKSSKVMIESNREILENCWKGF